jgi:hypothetical protein
MVDVKRLGGVKLRRTCHCRKSSNPEQSVWIPACLTLPCRQAGVGQARQTFAGMTFYFSHFFSSLSFK